MLKFKNSLTNFMELGPIKQEASPVLLFKAILYSVSSVRKSVNTMIQSLKNKTKSPKSSGSWNIHTMQSCGSWNSHNYHTELWFLEHTPTNTQVSEWLLTSQPHSHLRTNKQANKITSSVCEKRTHTCPDMTAWVYFAGKRQDSPNMEPVSTAVKPAKRAILNIMHTKIHGPSLFI